MPKSSDTDEEIEGLEDQRAACQSILEEFSTKVLKKRPDQIILACINVVDEGYDMHLVCGCTVIGYLQVARALLVRLGERAEDDLGLAAKNALAVLNEAAEELGYEAQQQESPTLKH